MNDSLRIRGIEKLAAGKLGSGLSMLLDILDGNGMSRRKIPEFLSSLYRRVATRGAKMDANELASALSNRMQDSLYGKAMTAPGKGMSLMNKLKLPAVLLGGGLAAGTGAYMALRKPRKGVVGKLQDLYDNI